MHAKKVRLSVTTTRFVTPDDEPGLEPQTRSLLITAVTFRMAVGLAETRKWFKAPPKHFLPGQTAEFGRALREALAEEVEVAAGPRGSSRFGPTSHLREFFAQPAQRRALARLVAFVEAGGSMTVTNE